MRAETELLRRDVRELADEREAELYRRYFFRYLPHDDLSLYRRLRSYIGRLLRWLRLRRERPLEPWLPRLKQDAFGEGAKPFIIWALDIDRNALRTACQGFKTLQNELSGWVPVLITNVPDFAYLSRLGWLVEYVPTLSEPASCYASRKLCYLAWRYRDAPAVPVSAGLKQGVKVEELELGQF